MNEEPRAQHCSLRLSVGAGWRAQKACSHTEVDEDHPVVALLAVTSVVEEKRVGMREKRRQTTVGRERLKTQVRCSGSGIAF